MGRRAREMGQGQMGLTSVMQSRRDVNIRSSRFPNIRDGRFDRVVRSELEQAVGAGRG